MPRLPTRKELVSIVADVILGVRPSVAFRSRGFTPKDWSAIVSAANSGDFWPSVVLAALDAAKAEGERRLTLGVSSPAWALERRYPWWSSRAQAIRDSVTDLEKTIKSHLES